MSACAQKYCRQQLDCAPSPWYNIKKYDFFSRLYLRKNLQSVIHIYAAAIYARGRVMRDFFYREKSAVEGVEGKL